MRYLPVVSISSHINIKHRVSTFLLHSLLNGKLLGLQISTCYTKYPSILHLCALLHNENLWMELLYDVHCITDAPTPFPPIATLFLPT